MPGTLTPSDRPCRRLLVLFERGRLESTVLGNSTNDHKKALIELLGMAALHLAYVPYASDGISAGGLFQWKRDLGPVRAYSLDPADYPRLPLFTWKGAKGLYTRIYIYLFIWIVLLQNTF